MPEMDGALGFPRPEDDLPRLPVSALGPLLFGSLSPVRALSDELADVWPRVAPLLAGGMAPDPATSRDYEVAAHWALYCDNYLEGFQIGRAHV